MPDPGLDPYAAAAAQVKRELEEGSTLSPRPDQVPAPREGDLYAAAARVVKQQQDEENSRSAQLLGWREANTQEDPARAADVLRYAAAAKMDPDFVSKNLDEVRKRVDAAGVDWNEVVYRQPALARFMLQRPEAQPLVKDDVANLKGLEWAIGHPLSVAADPLAASLILFTGDRKAAGELFGAPAMAFWDAVNEQRTIARQFTEAQGLGSEENRKKIGELEKKYSNKDYGDENLLENGLIGGARMLPLILGDIGARGIGAFIGGGAGATGGGGAGAAAGAPVAGVGAAPGALVGTGVGGLSGAAVGQYVGSGLFNYYESLGPLYWRLANLKDANGKPLDPNVARAFAQGGAVLNGALMAGFFGKITTKLPGVQQLLARVGVQSVEKVLVKQTMGRAVTRGLLRYGETVFTGAALMAVQSSVNQAMEEGAKGVSPDIEAQWSNVATAGADGFVRGLKDMWLISALGPGREMLSDVGRAHLAEKSTLVLQAMAAGAKDSKLLERYPDAFREALQQMKAEYGDQAVQSAIIPVERWTQYWQEKQVNPAEVAGQAMGDGGKAYTEALATKGDLVVPIEKYLTTFGKTDHIAGLALDTKLYQEQRTPREQAAFEKEQSQKLEKLAKERKSELDEGHSRVFEFVRDQATAADISKTEAEGVAKQVANFSRAMALRLNVSVEEAANLGALGRLRILGPKGDVIADAARRRFQEFLSPEASRLLKERLGSLGTEGRARELYLDPNTGILNERAFGELAAAPEKPMIGHISVEGIKYLNDNTSHDRADLLYRAVAKELHAIDPNAAKVGGDFAVRVKDQAELDAILNQVREKLPVKGFDLTGVAEKDLKTASAKHKELRTQLEAEGKRAPSRKPHPTLPKKFIAEKPFGLAALGLEAKDLQFPTERAKAEVPAELHQKVRDTSDEGHFMKAYVEEKTGLLTNEAWQAIPRKAYVAAFDLKGLGKVNEHPELGPAVGDDMIRVFGAYASHFGGSSFDFAHLHGDEYAAQHNDRAALEAFIEKFGAKLQNVGVRVTIGGRETLLPVEFRHGIGERTYEAADADLNGRKATEAVGTPADESRGGTGAPAGVDREGSRDRDRRRDGLHPGGEALGRGASRQGYPGGGEARLNQEQLITHIEGQPVTFEADASFDFGENDVPVQAELAREYVDGLGDPEKKAVAEQFLRYTQGELEKRPEGVTPEIEKKLAEFGLVDPVNGYSFDENNRDMARTLPGPRTPGWQDKGMQARAAEKAEELRKARTGRLDQPGKNGARGFIRMQLEQSGRPVTFDVQILNGDRSTLAHETAHFLSWSLHEIAISDLATAAVQSDYAALLKWAGYESPADREAATRERAELTLKASEDGLDDAGAKRLKALNAKEERISHGWEQYLAEGKAPSKDLAGVFTRFKNWMKRIYSGISGIQRQFREQYGEELGLSDEVRSIFDRLLAADQALEEARQETAAGPFEGALEVMTPEERTEYQRALEAARTGSDLEVNQRAAEIFNETVVDERKRVSAEVAAELDRQPVYRAMRYLQRGELAMDQGPALSGVDVPEHLRDKDGQPYKLNRKDLVEKYGAEVARQMPAGVFAPKKKGGIPVDQLAPLLGFQSGEELVQTFARTESRDAAIARETQARIDEVYGPAVKAIGAAAMSAVHSDEAARATLLENRAMAKQINPEAARRILTTDVEVLKRTADRLIGEATVRDLDPAKYQRAERQAALKRAELWGKGNKQAALEHSEARLLNQVLYRAARDAQDRLERAQRKLEKTSNDIRGNLGKADLAYRDVHDQILEAVGMQRPPAQAVERRGLDALLERAKQDAQEVDFDVDGIRRLLADPKPWDSLTVDQAQSVADAITNIRHLAKQKTEVNLAGKRQTIDSWFSDLTDRLAHRPGQAPLPYSRTAEGLKHRALHFARGADALLTDTESLAHMLDAGDRNGPAHRLLVDARLQARELEVELTKKVLEPIVDAWKKVPKDVQKLRDKPVDLAELLPVPPGTEARIAPVYTRDTLWMLFLNWGNGGNRQRIRDGNGWADANVEKALGLLTEPELQFLQGVLTTIDSLYPQLADVYRQRTGLELERVSATPISVNGKEYAGGYFPLRYDSRISRQGEVQEGDVVASLFAPNYVRPTVKSGHTKTRFETVKAPVDLSWGVVPAHLSQVIHDISYGSWVRQAGSIMLDPRFKALATQYLGPERADQFVPWLRDVANAKADAAAVSSSGFSRELGAFARSRVAVAALGANLPILLQNTIDPFNTLQEDVRPHQVAAAYVKVMDPRNWGAIPEFKLSKELAYRETQLKNNLRSELAKIGPTHGHVSRAISETAFALYEYLDAFSTRVGFKAAFDQGLSDGLTREEAAKKADDVVRRMFASHDVGEKARILRSREGIGSLLMFYAFSSKIFNARRRGADDVYLALNSDASTADKSKVVSREAAKYLFLGVVGTLGALLAGRGPGKDEDPKKWAAWRVLMEPLNTVPFVGPLIEGIVKGQKISVRAAPELALVQDTINRLSTAWKKAEKGGRNAEIERAWAGIQAMVVLAGGPFGQIQRTGGYAKDLATGEARPKGAGDVAKGLVYGPPR